jgi:hypothetical protein
MRLVAADSLMFSGVKNMRDSFNMSACAFSTFPVQSTG